MGAHRRGRALGQAYGGDINLLPVMVYIWGILGVLQPAFHTAIDASDTTIRVFLKAPASLADIGLVLAAMWSLRTAPGGTRGWPRGRAPSRLLQ